MRRIVCSFLLPLILISTMLCKTAFGGSIEKDIIYDIVYNAGVQTAEEAGYTDYEVVVDDNYNVTIKVFDTPTATNTAGSDKNEVEEPQKILSEETQEPNEILGSNEELSLGLVELERDNIVDAMQHLLASLPNVEAEKIITDYSYDYVDELMFSEDYQAAQDFMLKYPFDGYEPLLAECNVYCFPIDLAKGLEARWNESNADTTTWSDKQVREWYQRLVGYETDQLNKYMMMGFSDPHLANYAYAYIGALQSQLVGSAYYGIDNEKFDENWLAHGYDVRMRLIYLINREYGITIGSKYKDAFKESIESGQNIDYVSSIVDSITEQLSSVKVEFGKVTSLNWLPLSPFKLKNTSGHSMTTVLYVDIFFLDEAGREVERKEQLFVPHNEVKDGEDFMWYNNLSVLSPFSSVYFHCKLYDYNWDIVEFTVVPKEQYSWNGEDEAVVSSSEIVNETDFVHVEELNAVWTMIDDVYVPSVEFIIRNNGSYDVREATIECAFVNTDDGTEWSREKYYAISAADTPLHSGQGRSAIIYSQKGYDKKTRKVPNLSVEIYVNGEALKSIDVTRP